LWQQAGRSGRRERPSLAVYVASEGPLDQYFMKSPQKLFRRPIECCHVDSQNKQAYPVKVPETQHSRTTSQAHTCKVTTSWFGFFRIQRGSGETSTKLILHFLNIHMNH
ncbi:hypothetical protein MKX01_015044, partial [Papaver californicum]